MVLGQNNPCREVGREIRIPYRRVRGHLLGLSDDYEHDEF